MITVLGSYPIAIGSKFIVLTDGPYTRRAVENLVAQLQLQITEGAFGEVEVAPVNQPFERIPQHAFDPGFGPTPPEPKACPHGIAIQFISRCVPCNTVDQSHESQSNPGKEP